MENIDEEIENIIKEANISDNVIVEDVIENFEHNINHKNDNIKIEEKCIIDEIGNTFKKIFYELLPYKRDSKNKLITLFIRIFQFIIGFIVVFGIFLPSNILKYHIILIIILLILFEIFDNKSLLSVIVNKIGKNKKYHKLVNIKAKNYILLLIILMSISIFNLLIPKYSLFSFLKIYIEKSN